MRSLPLPSLLVLLVLTAPAAAGPTVLVDGDRVEGTLLSAGDEAGFSLDALSGSELKITVKALSGSALEPEIVLGDPDGVRVSLASRYRHAAGSKKAKLRPTTLESTGRYTIVVRGLEGSTGTFKLKLSVDHPRKFKDTGRLEFDWDSDLTRFPAFALSRLTFKVRGRSGFLPRVRSLLQPSTAEVNVTGVTEDGTTVRGSSYVCPELGEYRMRIETLSPLGGEWKSKIKMIHPETDSKTHVVTGDPEGTYADDIRDVGTVPSLPLSKVVTTAEFRLTFSILNPTADRTWSAGETVSLMATLQNISPSDITVRFNRDPWVNIVVRNVQTTQFEWQLHPNASFLSPFETFAWADSRSWSTNWGTSNAAGTPLAPGEYDIVVTFQTDDARIPQSAYHRIKVK
jgi:hypothetical protein